MTNTNIITGMTPEKLASFIDLSLLRPDATGRDIEELIRRAMPYPFASLCVPPCHVALATRLLKDSPIKVGTVIGFPLGYQTRETKVAEAREAFLSGAGEIDMVMNIALFKSGELARVEDEVLAVVSALPGAVVKVIIECFYLGEGEKIEALEIAVRGGADYVKTSTGFAGGGATVGDVRLLHEAAAGRIKVKAAGGIRTLSAAIDMIEAGAERIGTSMGVEMIAELKARGGP